MSAKVGTKTKVDKSGVTRAEPVAIAAEVVKALELSSPKVLDWLKVKDLESQMEFDAASSVLVEVKAQINKAEAERHMLVDPLNSVVKHVNSKVKVFTRPRQDLEEHIKLLIRRYVENQRMLAVAAAEIAAKKADKQGAHQLAEDIREQALTTSVASAEGVSYRKKWTFRVIDIKKVPREYLVLDEAALRKEAGPDAKVTGIEFFEDTVVAVRA